MFVWNGIGCQFRVHAVLVPKVPNVPLPLASGVLWWGSVFLADSPPSHEPWHGALPLSLLSHWVA